MLIAEFGMKRWSYATKVQKDYPVIASRLTHRAMNLQHPLRRVIAFTTRRIGEWRAKRRHAAYAPNASRPTRSQQVHADERTIRRAAEAELGGTSSEESRDAYLRGDNPGGLHHGGRGPDQPSRHEGDIESDFDDTRRV